MLKSQDKQECKYLKLNFANSWHTMGAMDDWMMDHTKDP